MTQRKSRRGAYQSIATIARYIATWPDELRPDLTAQECLNIAKDADREVARSYRAPAA